MMSFTSLLHKHNTIQSVTWHASQSLPGVRFAIRQVSLAGRIELMTSMRSLVEKNEFLRAGDSLDQTDAAISDLLARKLYLEWGLREIAGLNIDGKSANVYRLIDSGPESLCSEIVDSIRMSLELSETERKNF